MLKKTLISFFTALLLFPNIVFAYSDYIYAGGENIGIDVKSDGVVIVGTYKIGTVDISKNSGLRTGDIIVSINGSEITSIKDLSDIINNIFVGKKEE